MLQKASLRWKFRHAIQVMRTNLCAFNDYGRAKKLQIIKKNDCYEIYFERDKKFLSFKVPLDILSKSKGEQVMIMTRLYHKIRNYTLHTHDFIEEREVIEDYKQKLNQWKNPQWVKEYTKKKIEKYTKKLENYKDNDIMREEFKDVIDCYIGNKDTMSFHKFLISSSVDETQYKVSFEADCAIIRTKEPIVIGFGITFPQESNRVYRELKQLEEEGIHGKGYLMINDDFGYDRDVLRDDIEIITVPTQSITPSVIRNIQEKIISLF